MNTKICQKYDFFDIYDIYCQINYFVPKIVVEGIRIWKQLMVILLMIKADYKLKLNNSEEKETPLLVLVSQ